MSVKTMGMIWEIEVAQRDLLVLLALADHADHNGNNAYPSLALIAWKIGASERTVSRALKRLERAGILEARQRPGKTTIYSIHPERATQKAPFKTTDPGHSYVTPAKLSPLTSQPKNVRGTPGIAVSPEPSITNHPTTTAAAVAVVTESEPERPTVFAEYERQFGLTLTAGIADTLKEMVRDYGDDWTRDALGITTRSGKRGNLRYVEGILRRWKIEGREPERVAGAPVVVDEKTVWRAAQKARPNVLYDEAVDMLLPAFKDEDDRRRYITEYLNMTYAPIAEEVAS
jgi:DnaD/phage-associated family protein